MKNLFLLPTDKPSMLWFNDLIDNNELILSLTEVETVNNQNIYITSDEEIKEDDWCYDEYNKVVFKNTCAGTPGASKKIILTTDPDLIADGVQSIDDEFLEWFVKNPSCEFVEIKNVISKYFDCVNYIYKIIIPQQEPYILEYNDGEITIGTEISASQEEINFKQSAVEWFQEQFNKYYAFSKEEMQTFDWMFNEAKEMEKDMVIDFAKKFSDFNGLTFNEQKVSKEYLEKFYTNKISKTKKCDWCNKRKNIDNGYYIGKLESSKTDKEFFICVDCNLKHNIV